jgi:zinc transport system substrate-binding protein
MAAAIAARLAEMDAGNADRYAANLVRFDAGLDAAEAEIRTILAPVRGRPFIVFHDAYRYFEEYFGITATGAVHLNPEVQPGAARIAEIQARIGELDAACVFAEPQFEPRLIETVIEGSNARSGVLDPLGAKLAVGPDAYADLLVELASDLAACLDDQARG